MRALIRRAGRSICISWLPTRHDREATNFRDSFVGQPSYAALEFIVCIPCLEAKNASFSLTHRTREGESSFSFFSSSLPIHLSGNNARESEWGHKTNKGGLAGMIEGKRKRRAEKYGQYLFYLGSALWENSTQSLSWKKLFANWLFLRPIPCLPHESFFVLFSRLVRGKIVTKTNKQTSNEREGNKSTYVYIHWYPQQTADRIFCSLLTLGPIYQGPIFCLVLLSRGISRKRSDLR